MARLLIALSGPDSEPGSLLAFIMAGAAKHSVIVQDGANLTQYGYCGRKQSFKSMPLSKMPNDAIIKHVDYPVHVFKETFHNFRGISYRWWRCCAFMWLVIFGPVYLVWLYKS